MKSEPCAVCGHSEINLLDGFYYCDECGTQNTNVRETIVEQKAIGDGTFAATTRRKLVQVVDKENEMSGEWYKWHAFNFLLVGLADDLISLGANPSFKTQLLWIWTRYIKMYQNKEELGLIKDKDNSITIASLVEEKSTARESTSVLENPEDENKKKKSNIKEDTFYRDINFVSKTVITSMLYLALNLDRCDVQLSHLLRYLKEGRISFLNVNKYFPEDFNLKAVPQWQYFISNRMCKQHTLRYTTMTLIRKLDLGKPVLPDLRKILNNIITDMCLPKEVYDLVCALMHLYPYDYSTIKKKHVVGDKRFIVRVPDYEAIVMSYVLVALKMCFGLDDCYEIEMSNVVDKFNEANNLERSYKFAISSQTKRLFSFREWCNYLKARKIMLCKHCFMMADTHKLDMDDYVFLEHLEEREEGKIDLTDKIAMEILDRLPQDTVRVIPKEEFRHSFTPMSTYTQVILDYCQDPEMKYLLSEDFTHYSLKYACEDLELIDIDKSKNIVVGVSESKKKITPRIQGILREKKSDFKMIYVKSCDNKNWLKTNRPTIDHFVNFESNEELSEDRESDHGYDSNLENNPNDNVTLDNNENAIEESNNIKLEMIEEEEQSKNIFDDEFEDLDFNADKIVDEYNESNLNVSNDNNLTTLNDNNNVTYSMCFDFEDDEDSHLGDIALNDSFKAPKHFNPDTFNRGKTIKDLVLAACKKYKIPIPKEFKDPKDQVKTRKRVKKEDIPGAPKRKKICIRGQAKKEIGELLNAYQENLEKDIVHQVSEKVRTVIEGINIQENNLEHIPNDTREDMDSPCHDENMRNSETTPEDAGKTNGADKSIRNIQFEDEDSEEGEPDWRTKGDPKFDEKKYDVNQLYVKVEEPEINECFSIDNDPIIKDILSEKIIDVHKNARKIMKLHASDFKQVKVKKSFSSDSDDDLPLIDIQKKEKIIEEMRRRDEELVEPLIKNNIPVFKYWLRHYGRGSSFMKNTDMHEKFEQELKENFPKSFYFVLHECASILNCTAFHMYKHLQTLEKTLAGGAMFDDFDDL